MSPRLADRPFEIRGVTKVDYFHFECMKCKGPVDVGLGLTDGSVATIFAECDKCGESGMFKLARMR